MFKIPPFFKIIVTSVALALIGWAGLAGLFYYTLPTLGPRWLFFFLLMLALSGTFLPVTFFLNRRFPSNPPAGGAVVVRQAMWFGIYGDLLAWLQLGRVLNIPRATFLVVGFTIIEILLRLGEQSRWRLRNSGGE